MRHLPYFVFFGYVLSKIKLKPVYRFVSVNYCVMCMLGIGICISILVSLIHFPNVFSVQLYLLVISLIVAFSVSFASTVNAGSVKWSFSLIASLLLVILMFSTQDGLMFIGSDHKAWLAAFFLFSHVLLFLSTDV
jgi:hypothetical protein